MHPSSKTIVSTALLLTLSACGTLPTKEPHSNLRTQNLIIPSAPSDPLHVRTEADHSFILAEVYSHEGNSASAIASFTKVLTVNPFAPTVHLRLAEEFLKEDKVTEAIRHTEIAAQQEPKNIETHLFLGGLYSTEKLYAKAISQYDLVLRLQPKNEEAPIYIGSLYTEQKEYKKAERYFGSLLKNPQFENRHIVHYYLGLVYQAQDGAKHKKAAENEFKKSLTLKPDFEEAVVSLANLYLKHNERKNALSVCLEFQKQNSFHQNVAEIIAQIHIEEGAFDKAYAQFSTMVDNSDSSLETQMKMALLLIEQKQFNLAASKLKDLVAKSPALDTPRYYLAAVYEETGSMDQAIREYMQIPPTSVHFSDAIVHAAHLLKGLGKLNQALDLTANGLKTKGDKPQVYTMYASLLDAKSDYLGAARVLEEGLTKYAQNVGLLFQHAVMLDRLGEKDSMITQMRKVLEIEPNHVQSMSYLAFTLAEMNQHLAEAEKLARRALELEPKDGYVLDTLGWVLFKQNKVSESIHILEKAYGYKSSESIIAEHLAEAYLMQSMTKEAKEMYGKAADLTTDKTRATQIRNKILKLVY